MLASLVALLLLAPAPTSPRPLAAAAVRADTGTVVDSTADERRSARRAAREAAREKRPPKSIPVTPAHLATAFRDERARTVLALARAARTRQDSALQSYDATTYQRVSAGLGVSRFARDRLAFRSEQATRVQWRRGSGAYVEVTGSRAVVPIAGRSGHTAMNGDISPVPYYPGSESIWIGASMTKTMVDENEQLVHPLAEGAEAYYTYETGDSVSFRLPDGRSILLRELKVRPRQPKWNLAVGSLWFDMAGGQLVRAAYRMSVPMDIVAVAEADDSSSFSDVPAIMKPLLFPMTAQISAIGVEYGLYEGRFWLPRLQVAEGGIQVGVVRSPVKLEQRFDYSEVNAGAPLPPIVVSPSDTAGNRQNGDVSVTIGTMDPPRTKADSARAARRAERLKCDSGGTRSYVRTSRGGVNPVRVSITCDTLKLAQSKDLPASIYDNGEDVVNRAEMDALVADALSMGAQAGYAPQLPQVGWDQPRYNRIEGLSLGARADQVLGNGYSAHASARIGLADWQPNVELSGSRSDLRRTITLGAYNRLVSANDWGNPLSFGRSLNAFLFGRDEGYYYRASGLELTSTPDQPGGLSLSWGLFAEHERTASPRTSFSLARVAYGTAFDTNLVARRGVYGGGRARLTHTLGEDPEGFRLFSDARVEAAEADAGAYGRVALDLTGSHAIGGGALALTLAGGTSAGTLPTQRYWFLGGAETVRGQAPGAETGSAFWLARGELARGFGAVRPVLFGDLGWAGDRDHLREVGRPMSGAGIGASILDGLVRVDVARGFYPTKGWRVESYLEGRF